MRKTPFKENELPTSILRNAFALSHAALAHSGQERKFTGAPYIFHPIEVARIVDAAGGDDAMVAAALLHDTVEDTGMTHDDVLRIFGTEVAFLVFQLTNKTTKADGDRAYRHEIEKAYIKTITPRAKAIKLADIISNTADVADADPEFAKEYLPEKLDIIVDALEGQSISPALEKFAKDQVLEKMKQLGIEV